MFFTTKGFEFPIIFQNGEHLIDFRFFLRLTTSASNQLSISDINKILHRIPKEFYSKVQSTSKGRNSKIDIFLTPLGIISYLSSTYRFSHSEKQDVLNQFKKLGLVSNDLILSVSRSELSFLSDLQDFFAVFGKKVNHQVTINGYVIDYTIDSFAIEFDENNHKSYSLSGEKKREEEIANYGYKLIRVSDKKPNAFNLAVVAKEVL